MPEFIDLAQEIYHNHPVYHTHQKTVVWTDTSHEESQEMFEQQIDDPPFTFETKAMLMCDHGPTHVDAPRHFDPEGESVENMSLDQFYTPGKAIDVSGKEPGEYITPDDIEAACEDAGVTIEEGDTLLLRTGHFDEHYPTGQYARNYPGLDGAAAEMIIDAGITNFGVDSPSPDTPEDITYPTHVACRENNVPHMENLRNIDKVVGEEFTFIGFPLAIREGTGSPIRPVAMLE
jgi:kynurenine formamidase